MSSRTGSLAEGLSVRLTEGLAPAELGAHLLANGFAKWQLPDRVEFIDAVPRTSTGAPLPFSTPSTVAPWPTAVVSIVTPSPVPALA